MKAAVGADLDGGAVGGLRRRSVLIAGSVAGGALLVGCTAPTAESRLGEPETFAPQGDQVALNGWVKLTPAGEVIVACPRAEMGQGVHTALAMLVAEELDADWSRVRVEAAPVAPVYANQALLLNVSPFLPDDEDWMARWARAGLQRAGVMLSLQVTGGSSSVRDAWGPMRLAGATARAMLVQAAARRWQVPEPECRTEAGRVLHRGSDRRVPYGELLAEAARSTPPRDVQPKARQDWRLLGRSQPRLDLPSKTDGRAVFGIDVRPEGLLHAAIRHSPVFGGSVRRIDASAARVMRGVKKVLQLGRSAVVVVADNTWRAFQALEQVTVDWDDGPYASLDSKALSAQLHKALDAGGDAQAGTAFRSVGHADRVLAEAAWRVEAVYEAPFLAHAAMEPVNCTAQFRDGMLTVWCGTQSPSLARWRAAQVAGVATDRVRLHTPLLGGGFGRRLEIDMVEEAVAIALEVDGAPVRLTWSREEDFRHDVYRPAAVARFEAALDAEGRPLAWRNRVSAPSIGRGTMERLLPALAADSPDKNQIEGAFELPYAIPNLSVRQVRPVTPVPVGSWRSVGHSYNAFFTECFADELAHAAHQDPLAWRLGLLGAHPRHAAVLRLVAEQSGWGQVLPSGRARGIALHESFGTICAQVAEVSVEAGHIRVHRVFCALDAGTVIHPDTVEAQMQSAVVFGLSAALDGEITVTRGRVDQGNFPDSPVLTMADMPHIETRWIRSDEPPGGVGEPGTPPIAPAVANAVFALTGQRLRRLPLRLSPGPA